MSKDDNTAEVDRLIGVIRERLRRVPPSVTGGSYQTTIDFKEVCKKANKLLESKRPTLAKAQEINGLLNPYF